MTTFALPIMASELRKAYPELAKESDDLRCFWDFCLLMLGPNCTTDGISIIDGLDKLPMTSRFVQQATEKRQKLLRQAEANANAHYTKFKADIIDLMKNDPVILECAELAGAETSIGFEAAADIVMIKTGVVAYYAKNESPASLPGLQETYKCAVDCFKCLLVNVPIFSPEEPAATADACADFYTASIVEEGERRGIPSDKMKAFVEETKKAHKAMQPTFTKATEFIREPIGKISNIFQRVNPNLRIRLIADFKEVLRRILSCFIFYRFPVALPGINAPVYFGKFIGCISLKGLMELLGMSLGEFVIHP